MRQSRGHRNLTWNITHDLGVSIVAGEYSSGAAFPTEAELCLKFGASRSVLREAVKMLTAKGLLSARPRQGTRIESEDNWNLLDPDVLGWLLERKFSLALIREFTETRRAFEPQAAYLATQRATDVEKEGIRQALARMKAAEHGDDDPLQSDIAFHVAILKASGNRFFKQLEDLIDSALRCSIRLTNQFKGVRLASIADHGAVLEAIEAGDPDAAQVRMTKMLDEALELITEAENGNNQRLAARQAAAN
ncbi:MAG: FadR family transcriptional regulator [Alphaproteobacteria bacterium]|nr:MAG: FadR family transcriptional regulator [Alphaproteobacteria bacterium]